MKKKIIVLFYLIVLVLVLLCFSFVGCDKIDNPTKYNLDVNLNCAEKTAIIASKITFKTTEKTDTLKLVFNANVFSSTTPAESHLLKASYPNGLSFGEVNVKTISVNEKVCTFSLDYNVLTINLAKPLNKGKNALIAVDYSLKLPNTTLRYGYNNQSINMANFYPQLMRIDSYNPLGDPFYSEVADYTANITLNEKYSVLASGDALGVTNSNQMKTYSFDAKNARDFVFVCSNVFSIFTVSTDDGVKINYAFTKDSTPDKTLELAKNALTTFSRVFGKYNRKTLNICEVDFVHGGMEFAGLIYITKEAKGEERDRIVIHEIAHQWWYGAVGSDQLNHSWQDEGLTEFSVYLFYKENNLTEKAGIFKWNAKESMNDFEEFSKKSGVAIDSNMDRNLDDFLSSYEYTYSAYTKGFLMFEFIYDLLGEEHFLNICKTYFTTYLNKIATPQNLFDIFDKEVNGSSLILKTWLNGKILL